MNENTLRAPDATASGSSVGRYEPPTVEWISLDCEISSYAPDGGAPDGGEIPLF